MPKVIVLTTGGTIGHRSERSGVAVMDFNPAGLAEMMERALPGIELEFRDVIRKGSMDIGPDDWIVIATAVADAVASEPDGVVITHGTDTMHYTAAALAFMLRDLPVPVAMTGSMIPGGDPNSDSMPNLRDAIAVAARAEFAEVCVVFAGAIVRGCRARKVHSHAIDAFISVNAPLIGAVEGGRIVIGDTGAKSRSTSALRLVTPLDTNVVLVKLTPNMTPAALTRQLQGASGAVLEGTGVGHIRTDLQPTLVAFGKPVVIATQTVQGGEKLGAYDADRAILSIPNIILGGDMSSDTALVKLMWALPQGGDIKALMRTNIAGEIG